VGRSTFFKHWLDKVAGIFDATAEMQREASHEDSPRNTMDCVEEQGREAGAAAAQADTTAGVINLHPSPPLGSTWEPCGDAATDSPLPLPPMPTTPLQAFLTVALYPTELGSGEVEHFQAKDAFTLGFERGYLANVAEPVDVCDQWVTPSGHVIPPLDVDAKTPPDEVLAACVYEMNPPPWAGGSASGVDSGSSGIADGGSVGSDSSSVAADE
jgi:hypothetical protein